MDGKGTLTRLEQLKAEHGPRFKAAAGKRRHKRDERCAWIRCPRLLRGVRAVGGSLRIDGYCRVFNCPRHLLGEYLKVLARTRHWRQRGDPITSSRWWNVCKKRRDKIRRLLKIG